MDSRYEDLKRMLISRQRELLADVQAKMRSVRDEGSQQHRSGLNPGDLSDVEAQDDLEFALMQMKAETANKIKEALVRLEEGGYGLCFECGEEIAQPRLRALPFAVRCKDCEEAIEMAQQRDRARARRAVIGPRLRDRRLTEPLAAPYGAPKRSLPCSPPYRRPKRRHDGIGHPWIELAPSIRRPGHPQVMTSATQ